MQLAQKLIMSLSLGLFSLALTACGGDGRGNVDLDLPQILQAAQGTWHSRNGCELVNGSSLIGSAKYDSVFSGSDYIEYANYYSDDYCVYPETQTRTTYTLRVGGVGPGGYGNQIDFVVRNVTITPLTTGMANDYNADGECGLGWQVNVERDISGYSSCPVYNFSSGDAYTEEIGKLTRQILDVDGNEIYMGVAGGSGYPTYYENSPSLVR